MKKIVIFTLMSLMTMAANAQLNYTVQTACHPDDVKHYDTERLRGAFLMEKEGDVLVTMLHQGKVESVVVK